MKPQHCVSECAGNQAELVLPQGGGSVHGGPPTLFLTFSCAEYESPDIIDYLKIVNNVPENAQNLNVGKMCIEDPGVCLCPDSSLTSSTPSFRRSL